MDPIGMDTLSSAAAQGEQASEPHHANGYNFTGADPNVRTLEDAVRHGLVPSGKCTGTFIPTKYDRCMHSVCTLCAHGMVPPGQGS